MTTDHDIDMFHETDEIEDTLETSWYDYHRFASEGILSGLVVDVVQDVDALVVSEGLRKRKQKPADRKNYEACIDSIVSNLAYVSHQWKAARPIVVSRKTSAKPEHTNAYLPTKTFISCLDLLAACGYLSQSIGARNAARSTITATARFHAQVEASGLDFSCFRECESRPLVVLKRSTKGKLGKPRRKEAVSVPPGSQVSQMAAQVGRLNTFLKTADIGVDDDGVGPVVDAHSRTLVRYFTTRDSQAIRFDQGGRLFGPAFWLALRSDRRDNIRIDREPVADLDFKNLGPRLAYALTGHKAPGDDEDLYDLSGLLHGYDHREHRKAIKQALASLLNGGKAGSRDILDKLPKGTTAEAVREAIWTKHPALRPLCDDREVPVGFAIMFIESRILLCALEKLMALGVVALPVHDGLMCARSKWKIAQEALEAASKEIVGVRLPVVLKADYGPAEATEKLLAA